MHCHTWKYVSVDILVSDLKPPSENAPATLNVKQFVQSRIFPLGQFGALLISPPVWQQRASAPPTPFRAEVSRDAVPVTSLSAFMLPL